MSINGIINTDESAEGDIEGNETTPLLRNVSSKISQYIWHFVQ